VKSYYKTQEHGWPHKRTAELDGHVVRFESAFRIGTYALHGDAIQALKEAGFYKSTGDADRILIDGRPHRPTH